LLGAPGNHGRKPPSWHCGTGIAPDRDTTGSWRDVDEPRASLPAVPPGRARARRGNCRLFDAARRNPARDGLSAGGRRIRNSSTAPNQQRLASSEMRLIDCRQCDQSSRNLCLGSPDRQEVRVRRLGPRDEQRHRALRRHPARPLGWRQLVPRRSECRKLASRLADRSSSGRPLASPRAKKTRKGARGWFCRLGWVRVANHILPSVDHH